MLLVIDVGNSDIAAGVFEKKELKATFRMSTRQKRTCDEYGILMCSILAHRGIDKSDIEDAIISSVVPDVMHSLVNCIKAYFHIKPLNVGPGCRTGIRVAAVNAKDVGTDRIVDAVAAYEIYKPPVLVVDFGTATTYDLITEDATLAAGITSPGLEASAKALWSEAAKLPKIAIEKPKSILTKDTISSMQAGLIYGYIGQVEYIVGKVREESGIPDLKVIATGGLGKIIANETASIDVFDEQLTLKGLRIIYEKMKRNRG